MSEPAGVSDETVAYIAVRRLQDRYADIVTRRAWTELAQIVRPDCTITIDLLDRSIDFVGPSAIGEFIGTQLERFDFFEFVILNTVVDIDAARGVAAGRMYMQEMRQTVEGRRSDTYGVYHDRFERDRGGRWWFARRLYQTYARENPGDDGADLTVFSLPVIRLDELLDG